MPEVNQQNGNGKPKVVTLRPVNEGHFAHTITQEDLLELIQLFNEFTAAREAWEKKRECIKAALRSGARVEDGVLTARLVKGTGGGCVVGVYSYEKLVVR